MKISAFVALAGVGAKAQAIQSSIASAEAPAGRIFFDEDLPCDDFADRFPQITIVRFIEVDIVHFFRMISWSISYWNQSAVLLADSKRHQQ